MKLYSYRYSSAAYRVRIGLNLKNVVYAVEEIDLTKREHQSDHYTAVNPHGLVPALELASGDILTQSTAILEWLETTHPEPALLPGDAVQQARIRAVANSIACDIHPLNNLRVRRYLPAELGASEQQGVAWYHHWIKVGFTALEQQLSVAVAAGDFAFGDRPSLADVYLVPQFYNALRFEMDVSVFPRLHAIYQNCNELEAFQKAAPFTRYRRSSTNGRLSIGLAKGKCWILPTYWFSSLYVKRYFSRIRDSTHL